MDPPELIIPTRFDHKNAVNELRVGKEAGDETAKGLQKAHTGLQTLRWVVGGIGSDFNAMAQKIQDSAKQFQQLRAAMQEIAALSRKEDTRRFTSQAVEKGPKASLKAEELKQFREAFLEGGSLDLGEGPSAKMTEEAAGRSPCAMAEYAQQHGVDQQQMGEFSASLPAQQKGRTSANEMIARASQIFSTLEAASAPPSHLIPGLTELHAQGLTGEEAAQIIASMLEIAPGQEATRVQRTVMEIQEKLAKDQIEGADYGIKENLSPHQRLKGVVETVRMQQAPGGKNPKAILVTGGDSVSRSTHEGLVEPGTRKDLITRLRQIAKAAATPGGLV